MSHGHQWPRKKLHAQGHLQREQDLICEAPFSYLAKYILAFGGLSAAQVQKIAMMAKQDGIKHTFVDKLARLGTTGKHHSNIHRDLMVYMPKYLNPYTKPEADCVKIPLNILKGEKAGTHLIPHYYLAPHKLMSYMYHNFKISFQDTIYCNCCCCCIIWQDNARFRIVLYDGRPILCQSPGTHAWCASRSGGFRRRDHGDRCGP